jgi:hypothetical protein
MKRMNTREPTSKVIGYKHGPYALVYDGEEPLITEGTAVRPVNFEKLELFFKDQTSADIFDDSGLEASITVPGQQKREEYLGRNIDYAGVAFQSAERTHCFPLAGAGE